MAESGGYRSIDYSSQVGGRLAYFPDDFKEYVDTQLSCSPVEDYERDFIGWVFQSRHEPELSPILLHYILDLNYKIKDVLRKYLLDCYVRLHPTLVQFWAPTMTMEGQSYLTTQNQPFALATRVGRIGDVKGLCGYRMITKDYKFYMDRESSDEQLGVPGRVFNHGLPESTPNVEYYSIKEYPLRDHALRCQVAQSLSIPVFYPSTRICVGVLEIVSTTPSKEFLFYDHYVCWHLLNYFEEVGLKCSISFAHHHKELNVRKSEALDEISKVLEVVREVHGLPFAQAWAPCRVDWTFRSLVKGDIFHVIRNFYKDDYYKQFGIANVVHHLRKGQGVVGRAFSAPNVLLCKDVTQLSIIDYPLAHYARDHELSCCFAICVQSSCTRNDIYVLECFMLPSNKDHGNQQTALRKILETMNKNF